jgi:acyl carrier protein
LQIDESGIDLAKSFFDYGLTSSQAMLLAEDAGQWSGLALSATLAWKYPTVEELSRYLSSAISSNGREYGSKPVEKKGAGAAVTSVKRTDEFESQSVEEIAELLRSEIGALRQRKAR